MTNDVIKEAVAKQQSTDRKLSTDNSVLGKVMTFHIRDHRNAAHHKGAACS